MKNTILICFSFLFFGCSNTRISDGRYYDPTSTFSVDAESSLFNLKTHEFSEGFHKRVSFTDDLGMQVDVEVLILPQEYLSIFLEKNTDEKMDFFDSCFRQAFSELVERFPETFVRHEENLFLEHIGPAKHFILSIPEGSHLADRKTMQRVDCTRGYLISMSGNHIIINTFQKSIIFGNRSSFEDSSSNFEDIKNKLIKMRSSYRDETANH